MIVLYHDSQKIVKITGCSKIAKSIGMPLVSELFKIAKQNPRELLVWCTQELEPFLNVEKIKTNFHHQRIMASFSVSGKNFLSEWIGYVEDSPFLKINRKVTYPTWLMSADVGGIYAEALLTFEGLKCLTDFEYFLSSMAKTGQPNGLLCYSEPALLLPHDQQTSSLQKKYNQKSLFRFVKQHYRSRWLFLLGFNLWVYENKYPINSFLKSFFYRKFSGGEKLSNLSIKSNLSAEITQEMDVIIPTIGRKKYLFDVLKDLANQSILPQKVIIVEQNPNPNSLTELDYLQTETWPFLIEHTFTHQTGACQARNLALQKITASWVFLADDDIRITNDFIEIFFQLIEKKLGDAFTLSCLRKGENEKEQTLLQWKTFGSGCSVVRGELARGLQFDTGFEHGFGEDADYGMQLRNWGVDVLYIPHIQITHLKAPVGGFRKKVVHPWDQQEILPKPSPTVLLFKLKHQTPTQILGYKTVLFFKFYRKQSLKNPFKYFNMMQKRWKSSILWARQLQDL